MSPSDTIPLSRIPRSSNARRFSEDNFEPPSPTGTDANDGFLHPFSLDLRAPDVEQPTWKRELHALLEQPTSSIQAFCAHIFLSFLIVTSAVITILETVPAFHSISGGVWFGLETSLVALFTIEYVARCLAWSATWISLLTWVFCEAHLHFLAATVYADAVHVSNSVLWHHRSAGDHALLH